MTNRAAKNTAPPTVRPFKYSRRDEGSWNENSHPCAHCGRSVDVTDVRKVDHVHVVDGGASYGGEGDTNEPGDMGWFAVGADCAKRLRKAGIYTQVIA